MSDARDTPIEHLWFIQSFEGNDSGSCQFYAASQGLQEDSERVKRLERYAPYKLPPRTGSLSFVSSFDAPASLTFIWAEHDDGRILIYKFYENSYSGPQVHIHMLVGLPTHFSAVEAIALWKANLWRRDDRIGIRSNILKTLSFTTLKQQIVINLQPYLPSSTIERNDLREARKHLPFVIQAYLLQQAYLEQHTTVQRPSILIAAPAAQVAYFIIALSKLLPRQLLQDMTFSTYEHDILHQQYRICGTCLLTKPGTPPRTLLDLASYTNDFVLDTYAGGRQSIPDKCSSDLIKRAAHYAEFMAKSLNLNSPNSNVRDFLKNMESVSSLTVDTFLEYYSLTFGEPALENRTKQDSLSKKVDTEEDQEPEHTHKLPRDVVKENKTPHHSVEPMHEVDERARSSEQAMSVAPHEATEESRGTKHAENVSLEEIVDAFKSPERAKKFLREKNNRQELIAMMLKDLSWLQRSLSPLIVELQGKQDGFLDMLIRDVNARAIRAVQSEDEKHFQAILNVLLYISPRTEGSSTWHDLLDRLAEEEHYYEFLRDRWYVREHLLDIARQVLRPSNAKNDRLVQPLLTVAPSDFGKLLAMPSNGMREAGGDEAKLLRLPPEWNCLATKQFISAARKSPGKITWNFEQHHEQVRVLIAEICSLAHKDKWQVVIQFFALLVKSGYSRKQSMLFQLFDNTSLPQQEAEYLLKVANLNEEEQRKLFRTYEALCIKLFPVFAAFREITLRSLPTFPLTWERMNNFVFMLDQRDEKEINPLAKDIAAMLDICIDSSIRLGMLFGLLIGSKRATTGTLLFNMAEHVRKAIDEVIASEERGVRGRDDARRIKARFSSYIQFALCVDTTYDVSHAKMPFGVSLLNHLLKDADQRVLDSVTGDAKHWPDELRMKWEHEKKKHIPKVVQVPLPQQERNAGPTSAATISSAQIKPEEEPNAEQCALLAEEKENILQSLKALLKKRSVERLAVFYLENYVALTAIDRQGTDQIDQNAWDCMRIAYDFSTACKKAENAQGESMEAELAIVNAYQESHNRGDLLNFTNKENRRVKLAQKKVQKASHDPIQQTK